QERSRRRVDVAAWGRERWREIEWHVRSDEDGLHARKRRCRRGVDRCDLPVCDVRAHEGDVEHSRQLDIAAEARLATEKREVLESRERKTDQPAARATANRDGSRHARVSLSKSQSNMNGR